MSRSSLDILDITQTWLALAADVAQARNLSELHERCTAALAVIAPGSSFELAWDYPEGPHPLAPTFQLSQPLPGRAELHLLHNGMPINPADGAPGYLPLRVGGDLRGWLRVTPGGWSADQTQALLMLAALLGPSIHTLTLHRPQGAPDQFGIPGLLDLEALLERIYQITASLIDTPNFLIVLCGDNSDWLELAYVVEDGQRRNIRRFWRQDAGLTGAVVHSQTLIYAPNYDAECAQRGIPSLHLQGLRDAQAWLGVPLLVEDRVIGVLCVFQHAPGRTYTTAECLLLQALSREAATAIHNARRYARAERQAFHLAILNRISRSITSTLDPEQVPLLIMQQVQDLFDVEESSLLLLDEQSGDLVFTYASGPTGNRLLGQRLPPGAGIAGFVVSSGQSAIVNDTRNDGRFYAATDDDTGFVTRSLLAVPLRGLGGVQGVIEVMNRRSSAPFTDEDRELLEAVADQAVIALENARRFAQVDQALARRAQELDRNNGQLREILRVGNALRAERRLDDLLGEIARAVSQSTGFQSAVIALVRRERTPQPYLQRIAAAGPVAAAISRLSAARAPLSQLMALLRPEFQRGPATYLIDQRYDDYIELWGGRDWLYIPDQPPGPPGGWHPLNALFSLMRDSRGELLGLLCVDEPEDGTLPTPAQVQMLEIFANQTAVAIENAHLYTEQQHSLQSMMALNGLGMALNATLRSAEQIFELTTSGMVEMTSAQGAALLLVAPARADQSAPQEAPAADDPHLHLAFSMGMSPVRSLLDLARQSIQSGRLMSDSAVVDGSDPAALSWVAIPLRATRRVLGAICVGYTEGLPSPADLETLTLFASQAAVAVESRDLFSAVRQGHDQLASIMSSTNEGLVLINPEGQIVVANNAFKRLVGSAARGSMPTDLDGAPHPLAAPSGMGLATFLERWAETANYPPGEWLNLRNGLEAVTSGAAELAQGQLNQTAPAAYALEWTALRANGAGSADSSVTSAGAALPLLLVLRDITAAKEAERVRQELASMMVHDLRSPLTSIMTSIDMIFKGVTGEVSAVQREILGIANTSAQQLLNMVNMLLDISRLEDRRMPLDRTPLTVDQLVQRAVNRLEAIARNKNITVELALPAELAPVFADAELILRVLQNLIDNALKFSSKDSRIVISASNPAAPPAPDEEVVEAGRDLQRRCQIYPNRLVTLAVRDFGIGIAPKYQEKIFAKFGQAGERRNTGSRLGLTFCKLVVEAHGGRLWVESEPGEGSTFAFTLPIVAGPRP